MYKKKLSDRNIKKYILYYMYIYYIQCILSNLQGINENSFELAIVRIIGTFDNTNFGGKVKLVRVTESCLIFLIATTYITLCKHN